MDMENSVESTLNQQQEEFRHIQSLSQRFLQVLLATLAITFVFARREWVNFFFSSQVPQTGLRIKCPSGAFVGGLSPTFVIVSGEILQALVIIGLACISLAGVWAARILFIQSPTFVPEIGRQQISANEEKIQRASQMLKEAHQTVALGIGLLTLAGIGYICFYHMSEAHILYFDVLVILVTVYLLVRLGLSLQHSDLEQIYKQTVRPAGVLLNATVTIVAAVYIRFVFWNAFHPVVLWLDLIRNICY